MYLLQSTAVLVFVQIVVLPEHQQIPVTEHQTMLEKKNNCVGISNTQSNDNTQM